MDDQIIPINNPKVKFHTFFRGGSTEISKSLKALRDAKGVVGIPPYAYLFAQQHNKYIDAINVGFPRDTNEEILHVKPAKKYDTLPNQDSYVFVIGASVCSYDIGHMVDHIDGNLYPSDEFGTSTDVRSIPLGAAHYDMLFGDNTVQVFDESGTAHETLAHILSYPEFVEAYASKDFFMNNPFYVVHVPAALEPREIAELSTHIRSGTSTIKNMYDIAFGLSDEYISLFDGNTLPENTGRIGSVLSSSSGFSSNSNDNGRSIGISQDDLDTVIEAIALIEQYR